MKITAIYSLNFNHRVSGSAARRDGAIQSGTGGGRMPTTLAQPQTTARSKVVLCGNRVLSEPITAHRLELGHATL